MDLTLQGAPQLALDRILEWLEAGVAAIPNLACGISYADDLEAVRKIAVEAIERVGHRDPGRDVEFYYEEFGGSSIDFIVRFWIPFTKSNAEYLGARSEAIVLLKQAFDDEGITIPFPIRTLDFGISGGVSLAEQIASSPLGS